MKQIVFTFLLMVFSGTMAAESTAALFEKAYSIEKISPRFSIPLYETVLTNQKSSSKIQRVTTKRLFYLYAKYRMYEELFILNARRPPDKTRRKYTIKIIQHIAGQLGLKPESLQKILPLAPKADTQSQKELLKLYRQDPSFHLFRYIFSIKLKINDKKGLRYYLSELSGINPVFKLVYILKFLPEKMPKYVRKYSSLVGLSNQQRMDILYLYAIYFRNQHRYRMAVRYLRSGSSFNTFNQSEKYLNRSMTEAARTLIISGRSGEGCSIIGKKKIIIQNPADQLLNLYCKKKAISKIRTLKPALLELSKRENGLFYKKILRIIY